MVAKKPKKTPTPRKARSQKRAFSIPRKKIAILGTTPSRMQGPIEDKSWEIWTIGPGGMDAHRWDRLFEVHHVWPEDFKGYLNSLSNVKLPQQVVTMKPMADLIQVWAGTHKKTPEEMAKIITGDWSANRLYPKDQIIAKYLRRMWFSSSISWLIALAMEEGATDIGLWGIDLESGEEYISQFVGCVHLLDLAQHKGINVHLPKDCGLLRDPAPYPDCYETHFALVTEKKVAWLQHNLGIGDGEHAAAQAELHRKEGALLTLRSLKATAEDIQKCEGELVAANQKMAQLAAQINQLRGELSTLDYLRRMYVMGMKQPQDPGWAL